MDSIEPNWPSLLWFCLLWGAACVAFLVVAGMLPLRSRPEGARTSGGAALVVWNALLLAVLAAGTALYGYAELRWTSVVVAGGLIFLFAPALFQAWPAGSRDATAGLALLLALQGAALALLYAVGRPDLAALAS
jgi:hypothetical protein